MSQIKKLYVLIPAVLMTVSFSSCKDCRSAQKDRTDVSRMRDLLTQMIQDHSVARLGYANQLSDLNQELAGDISKLKDGINDGKFDDAGAAWNLEQGLEELQRKVNTITDYATQPGGLGRHSTEITFNSQDALNLINQRIKPPGTKVLREACGNDAGVFAMLDPNTDNSDPRDPRHSTSDHSGRTDDIGVPASQPASVTSGEATI